METFTCITHVRDYVHLTQHLAASASIALREHIAKFPYDDGTGPFDEELAWLQGVSGCTVEIQLIHVDYAPNTWLWGDGARHDRQYITYIVKTVAT